MADFYIDTLRELLARGALRRDMKVLVVCAGEYDRQVLRECGFTDVTLSNLDAKIRGESVAPFAWSFQDAERLEFDDGEFDMVLVHSGLHHAQSPHRALLEMYRVARTGIVCFEPIDNPVTRLGVRLGLGQEYEVAAVAGTGYRFGGQRNTPIPNYVYRWTRREVEKTVLAFAPVAKHRFFYFYALRVPWFRSQMLTRRILAAVFLALTPLAWCATRLPAAEQQLRIRSAETEPAGRPAPLADSRRRADRPQRFVARRAVPARAGTGRRHTFPRPTRSTLLQVQLDARGPLRQY